MSYAMLSRKSAATPAATTAAKAASTNLRIGEPGDSFEQEADRVADAVMAGETTLGWSLSRMSIAGNAGEDEGSVFSMAQRKAHASGPVGVAPPVVHEVLSSPGQPLGRATQRFMQPLLGYDLSAVRVHSDSSAANSAKAISARAYTVGNHVIFGNDQYRPETEDGLHLLAHELTHVVQQQGMRTSLVQRQQDNGGESDAGQDEVFAALYSAIYSGVESLSPTILLAYADNLERKYEEAQATGKSPKSQVSLASILMRIYGSLRSDESVAERDADGALLAQEFGGPVPWASSRPQSVSEIPVFSTEHIVAWQADAAVYERQNRAARSTGRTKQRVPTAPPGFHDLVKSSGTPSAAPSTAQPSQAQAPSQAAAPAVEVQERTSDEKDYAKDPGGGEAVKHGLNVLKGRRLSSLTQPQGAAATSAQATAAASDPTLLDASAQIWFISNRLYLLDRTGHLQPREESWFDVSSIGGMQPGGVYFIQPVHEKVGGTLIDFRGVVLEGPAPTQGQLAAGIYFPRVLTALIPMLVMNAELARQQAGVGVIIAPSFGKRRLTVSDISLDKLLRALDRVPRNLPWAINAEFNRIKENPVSEVVNQALAMGIEYLSKFAPVVGQVAMAYQLLELAKWLGEVGNVAAYAQTDDEIDIAAQAIARKLAQYLVFEAISRSVKGGIRLASGSAKAGAGVAPTQQSSSKETGSGGGKPPVQEATPSENVPPAHVEEKRPAAATPAANESAAPSGAAEKPVEAQVPEKKPPVVQPDQPPPSKPPAGETQNPPVQSRQAARPDQPVSTPQPAEGRTPQSTPQAKPPAEQPAPGPSAQQKENEPPSATHTTPSSASAASSSAAQPGGVAGKRVHAIDDVLSADATEIAAGDQNVRSRFTLDEAAALDRLQSSYQSYKKKMGDDALSPEAWLRAQKSGQPRQDAEGLFGEDYARTGRAASAGAKPQVVLKDIPRPANYDEPRFQADLNALRSNSSVWDRLSALRSKGVTNGEVSPSLLNILKGNIGEILARPTLEARLKAVQQKAPQARLEFNTRVAKRRPDGTFEAPKLFSDGLVVSESGGRLKMHDAFEIKSGPAGGAEATSQFFDWREGLLESGDQLVLSDGRRFTYSPETGGPGTIRGMQTATPHIIAPRGAEHLGTGSGEQVGASGTRTALSQTASEIEYLARMMLESLIQNNTPGATAQAAGIGTASPSAAASTPGAK